MIDQMMIMEDGTEIVLIHFTHRNDHGIWVVACVPGIRSLHAIPGRQAPWKRTDDPRAVTCPYCQGTVAFLTLKDEIDLMIQQRRVAR